MPTWRPWNALIEQQTSNPSELHNNLAFLPRNFSKQLKVENVKMLFFVIDEHRTNSPPPTSIQSLVLECVSVVHLHETSI